MTDFTLPEDLDEIVREADVAVAKVKDLDAARAAAFAALTEARQVIIDKCQAAVTKIDAYLNPAAPAPVVDVTPAPEPVVDATPAPVADPAPAADPIVTTDPVVNEDDSEPEADDEPDADEPDADDDDEEE